MSATRPQPVLATTYEGDDPALLDRILPLIDAIEIAPDTIARSDGRVRRLRPEVLDEYAAALPHIQLVAHGIGLSIGSFDRWDDDYLRLLDDLFDRLPIAWHSEHLAYTTVDGENLGTMLPVPRTDEALDLICERVRRLQERYRVPFLLEHVIQLLPDAPAEHTPAAFLNAIAARTGCGLLLDAYNLLCDVHNHALNARAFLDELDLAPVRELHLAGGVEHKGFYLDIHSNPVRDDTMAIGLDIVQRAPNLRMVTFELLKEAVPLVGHDGICAQLTRIRKALRHDVA
jgi:uncharacterized protein (UPF0276 family)